MLGYLLHTLHEKIHYMRKKKKKRRKKKKKRKEEKRKESLGKLTNDCVAVCENLGKET